MKKALSLLLIAFSSSLFSQNFTLTSVVVNGLNDSWCGDIEETNWPFIGCTASPDPYATLTDANGNTVYQSASNVDNFSLELVLNIPLTDFPYTLTIWDEDGVIGDVGSNDDNLGNFTLDGSQTGTFTLSSSGTTITVSVMMSYPGRTDVNASNFNPNATMNDGTCLYDECESNEDLISVEILTDQWGYETSMELTDFNGAVYLYVSDFADNTLSTFDVCVPNTGVYSFTINDAYGDGICCDYGAGYYSITSCGELVASGGSFGESETVSIESCDYVVEDLLGCMNPNAFNFDVNATVNNGTCTPYILGCTDSNAINYNSEANTDNGSCVPNVPGCMNPAADNFNANATFPDGSCIFIVFGCTDNGIELNGAGEINDINGVVEVGIFAVNKPEIVIVGKDDGYNSIESSIA